MLRQILLILLLGAASFSTNAQNISPYWSLTGNSNASASSKLGTTTLIPLGIYTNNTVRATIATNGNVGIGTTSPQQRLHTEGSGNQGIFVSTSSLGTTSGSGVTNYVKATPTASGQRLGYFQFGSRGGAQNAYNTAGISGYAGGAWSSTSRPTYLSFETTPSGSTAKKERLRIDPAGNVGIGVTNPQFPLDVAGRVLLRSSGGGTAGLWLNNLANTSAIGFVGAANDNQIGLWGNPSLGWGLLMNTTTGNIGIGTQTPLNRLTVVSQRNTSYATVTIENLRADIGTADGMYIRAGTDAGTGDSYYIAFTRPDGGFIGAISQSDASSVRYQTVSDKRLKANIRETKFGLADVNKIQVKDYTFIGQNGQQTGFLAQQLYEVFPEAVSVGGEDPKTRPWMVDYGRITPLLVKGMQELNKENKVLKEENKTIKEELTELRQMVMELKNSRSSTASFSSAFLEQASPNPAKSTTLIRYSAPDGTSSAKLTLTNAKGQVLKEINLAKRGIGQVNLNTSALPPGVYNYTLWINGQQADSKQLIIAR